MQFKKYYVIMPLLFIIFCLSACTDRESEVVVNDAVKAEKEDKVGNNTSLNIGMDVQKLSTTSATKKIHFVDKKYTKFWDIIKYNSIDTEYNNTRIKKNNIRLSKKANMKYAEEWLDELDKTYKHICKEVNEDVADVIEKQYKAFLKYYDASKALYLGVIAVNNNYDAIIDGNDSVKQFYSLADEVRDYTILLKEYIFIKTGEIEFYKNKSEVKTNKNKYSDNNNEISLSIVDNDRVKDILTDYYSNKINCSTKKLNVKKAEDKTKGYSKYWKEELDNNYDNIKKVLNEEDRKMLRDQKDAYMDFVSKTLSLNKEFLGKTKRYTKRYKNSFKVDNNLYKGAVYSKYNVLLVEYYYMVTQKIDI